MERHLILISSTFLLFCWIPLLEGEDSGELGSIECVDGKWRVDTRLMALIMTCPLPLDGNGDSIMKMVKCVLNKLGIYDGETLSNDAVETVCSVFSQKKLRDGCLKEGNACALGTGLYFAWELTWPLFAGCFAPWALDLCNI